MIYHLSSFSPDQGESWENLGKGLWHGVTHPVDFGKAVIGLDALQERGFAYWLGNLAPAAAAAFFTGGGSAAARGATATERVVSGASRAPEWLKRIREGQAFDKVQSKSYAHNQLYVEKTAGDSARAATGSSTRTTPATPSSRASTRSSARSTSTPPRGT